MAKKDTDQLQGGTQHTPASPNVQPGSNQPGGTNALSPTGTARPQGHAAEPPTGDKSAAERQDPHRIEGGRGNVSPDVAAQRARDQADVQGSESGVDEGNPRQIPEDAPAPDGRTGND